MIFYLFLDMNIICNKTMNIYYQTRSDSIKGKYPGCVNHSSLKDAINAWKEDPEIWKISWFDGTDDFRFIMKTKNEKWSTESKLRTLSETYKNAKPHQVFWVLQDLLPRNTEEILKKCREEGLSNADELDLIVADAVRAVYTTDELLKKYT
jgi:hypothetical protein